MAANGGYGPLWHRRERQEHHPGPYRDRTWMDQAACRGHAYPDLWFSDQGDVARSICRTCPVVAECEQYARPERYGIWAGGRNRRGPGEGPPTRKAA